MNIEDTKEIISILKNAKFPTLIFLSIIILPLILPQWNKLFPESWSLIMNIIIVSLWIIAIFANWISDYNDKKDLRNKTILVNYLIKYKQRSINFLSKEWDAKNQFSEKYINHLLSKFPDELKRVEMAKGRGPGVGLVINATKNEIETI